jgi:uroporphyrinogen decarboxylase
MSKLVDQVASYVTLQIDSGVEAVQLFDTWVGCLSVRRLPRLRAAAPRAADGPIRGRVPVIYFGTGNGHLLADTCAAGRTCWPWTGACRWARPGPPSGVTAVQGNLDPIVLCADRAAVERQAALPCSTKPAAGRGTSSIWATASSPKPRWTTCASWSTSSTSDPSRGR